MNGLILTRFSRSAIPFLCLSDPTFKLLDSEGRRLERCDCVTDVRRGHPAAGFLDISYARIHSGQPMPGSSSSSSSSSSSFSASSNADPGVCSYRSDGLTWNPVTDNCNNADGYFANPPALNAADYPGGQFEGTCAQRAPSGSDSGKRGKSVKKAKKKKQNHKKKRARK